MGSCVDDASRVSCVPDGRLVMSILRNRGLLRFGNGV